jgi:hypothetical protein
VKEDGKELYVISTQYDLSVCIELHELLSGVNFNVQPGKTLGGTSMEERSLLLNY